MKRYFTWAKSLAFSATAKDTIVLFAGNVTSAFWAFLFTLFIARAFSVEDLGIFTAALNLVIILSSLTDFGISTGSVNFISEHLAKGNEGKANEYIKASFIIKILVTLGFSILVVIFAPLVATKLIATSDISFSYWTAAIPIFLFPDAFFPSVFQAKKKFFHSTLIDNVFNLGRLAVVFAFYLYGTLTTSIAFASFGLGFILSAILVVRLLRTDFFRSKPTKTEYKSLIRFSGWLGVNKIISSISGRLDVQMLAIMVGATATGIYSIPSKLASFIIVIAGSFSSVLAPRLAGFGDKEKEKKYIIKALLAILGISVGILVWIAIAKPFITILFGEKYLSSVFVFQALAGAMIPFLLTAPAVAAIIYAMKKTVFIGAWSFFQLTAIVALNYVFIPKYGPIGPTITYGITFTILAIYVWIIVIRHYWIKK